MSGRKPVPEVILLVPEVILLAHSDRELLAETIPLAYDFSNKR
jgi:hypothetical protein